MNENMDIVRSGYHCFIYLFFLFPTPPPPPPPLLLFDMYVLGISDQGVREPTTSSAQRPRGTSASYYCIELDQLKRRIQRQRSLGVRWSCWLSSFVYFILTRFGLVLGERREKLELLLYLSLSLPHGVTAFTRY